MGELCQNCKKEMEHPDLTHCSDECLFDEIKNEKPFDEISFTEDVWNSKSWV